MKRLKDDYLEIIDKKVQLKNKTVLEVGCGYGSRSVDIAKKCKKLYAIDPDTEAITFAKKNSKQKNITYSVGKAQELAFENGFFDVVIFTLSLHHVPMKKMNQAINEAVRVVKKDGKIIFFEPMGLGTFFETEILFDASDGDERKEKAYAYYSMLHHPKLKEEYEILDETIMQFDSVNDFVETMEPKKNLTKLRLFLEKHNYTLDAKRRINIFKV